MTTKPGQALSIEPRVYSVEEAAGLLDLCRNAAYEAVRRGDIPSIRIGRRIVVPKAALDRLLQVQPAAA